VLVATASPASGAAGDLEPSFSGDGIVQRRFGRVPTSIAALLRAPHGNIIAAASCSTTTASRRERLVAHFDEEMYHGRISCTLPSAWLGHATGRRDGWTSTSRDPSWTEARLSPLPMAVIERESA
jgi:hypothetical protein